MLCQHSLRKCYNQDLEHFPSYVCNSDVFYLTLKSPWGQLTGCPEESELQINFLEVDLEKLIYKSDLEKLREEEVQLVHKTIFHCDR